MMSFLNLFIIDMLKGDTIYLRMLKDEEWEKT